MSIVRFERMCSAFYEVADLAMNSESKCTNVLGWIYELKGMLQVDVDTKNASAEMLQVDVDLNDLVDNSAQNFQIVSPLVVRGKGRPPIKRKQSVVEKVVKQKRGRKKKIDQKKPGITESADYIEVSQANKLDTMIDKTKNVAGNMEMRRTCPSQQNQESIISLQNISTDEQTITVENLYPLVKNLEHDKATEVTNVLLKMDKSEVLHMLESPDTLKVKVLEAVKSLQKALEDISVD